ncbi:MAG: NAD(P)/FAD-dependent oxidoreductase [Lachnospiraceae bacterium]|nr:NAD(P)/FAD-dependent oxidoreductase [Lachnospiraceae bacterium]
MHDFMIIGSGPAGVSAALTAQARDLSFLWFGSPDLSIKIEKAERIRNYPGLPDVTGEEMRRTFQQQIKDAGIRITPERINAVYSMGSHYAASAGQKIYESKAILLATGIETAKPIPGETELLGKGVSYCATCDGFLYKQKNIAVICTSPKFNSEIDYLAGIASALTLFTTYKGDGSPASNITHHLGLPSEILGTDRVQAISYQGQETPVDGVFILRESISPAVLLKGLEMQGSHIQVDRAQKTNLPGCYAAGDCTGRPYQYAKAAGEGNVAVHSILEYLSSKVL